MLAPTRLASPVADSSPSLRSSDWDDTAKHRTPDLLLEMHRDPRFRSRHAQEPRQIDTGYDAFRSKVTGHMNLDVIIGCCPRSLRHQRGHSFRKVFLSVLGVPKTVVSLE